MKIINCPNCPQLNNCEIEDLVKIQKLDFSNLDLESESGFRLLMTIIKTIIIKINELINSLGEK